MAREFSKAFYNSKEWQAVRDYCLFRDNHACVKCGAPAEEVHHKKHLSPQNIYDINVTLNPDNLISLCHDCHFKEHRGQHGKGRMIEEKFGVQTFDENGFLLPTPPV